MTKAELIAWLTKNADANGGDPHWSHSQAELMLLEYVNDPAITAAWMDAKQFWWYA